MIRVGLAHEVAATGSHQEPAQAGFCVCGDTNTSTLPHLRPLLALIMRSMALSTYTTFEEIRAALGVSSTELTDAVLAIPSYELVATLALEDVDLGIPTLFATTGPLSSPTTQQKRFNDLVKLYATYAIAQDLLTSLPLFAVRALTDGRASFDRITDPFAYIRESLPGTLTALRYRLAAAYATANGSVLPQRASLIQLIGVGLATDPVTNT